MIIIPYSNVNELPPKVKQVLPLVAQKLWMAAFNTAIKNYGEERAFRIAWAAVKKKFKKKGEKWVAKSEDLLNKTFEKTIYYFEMDNLSVAKSDEHVFVDYVLSSNSVDKAGHRFSDFALKQFVNQINAEGLKGRVDEHELFKKLQEEGLTTEEIEQYLQSLDTGIEAVNARYDNGKVIAKIRIKSDLFNKVNGYNGASIEARIPKQSINGNEFRQARLTGFVLTNNPVNPEAIRVN